VGYQKARTFEKALFPAFISKRETKEKSSEI